LKAAVTRSAPHWKSATMLPAGVALPSVPPGPAQPASADTAIDKERTARHRRIVASIHPRLSKVDRRARPAEMSENARLRRPPASTN
jgi:hypothetical protein